MNRFAIPESEVERLLKDRKKYDYSQDEQQQDVSALVARISTLEKEVDTLKKKLTTEPEKPVARPTSISRPAAPQRTPEPRSTMPETAQSASDGNIAARIFGPEMHGLTPKTVNEHINGGKIKATPRDASPGRDKWFFSPEEQRDAVKYWRENHTKGFHPCKDCPHQL
jgi:tRNA C32,U32 (ribose-2'-O)-methylase TrmJ